MKRCQAKAAGRECGRDVAPGMLACCRTHVRVMIPSGTPGVFKRGGRWVVVWKDRGSQRTSSHTSKALAVEDKARRMSGDRQPQSRARFDDYAREWVAGHHKVSDETRSMYAWVLEAHAIPHFRGTPLGRVSKLQVRAFVQGLEQQQNHRPACKRRGACDCPPLAASSVTRYVAVVRALFASAVRDDAIARNPCAGLEPGRQGAAGKAKPPATLTRAELAAVLAELPDRWRPLFGLLAASGLRVSEALGLDKGDVVFPDVAGNVVAIGGAPQPTLLRVQRQFYRGRLKDLKTESGHRVLPLPAGLAGQLRPLCEGPDGPLFHTMTDSRFSDRNVRRVLDAATERAGLGWRPGFHVFRHSVASMLFEEGRNARQVSDWLGHADAGFTLRTYVHQHDAGLGGPLDSVGEAAPAGSEAA